MIPLTDADKRTLQASKITIDFGCDVLDDNDNVIDTLGATWVTDPDGVRVVAPTSDLLGGTITHNSTDEVQRSCELQIIRKLDWTSVWLRPWQSVTANGHTVSAYLGVFRPTQPELPAGTEPLIWTVHGMDRLSMMQDVIGDTVVSPGSAIVSAEVQRAITAAQVPGAVITSSDIANVALPKTRVWLMNTSQQLTFIKWANGLADAAGAQALFMDGIGRFIFQKNQPTSQRVAGWVLDADDKERGIVGVARTAKIDNYSTVNWWRFIISDRTARPVEGVGQYTVDRSNGKRKVRNKSMETDAVDYASLVALADQQIEQETSRVETIQVTLTGFNPVEHRDVFDYKDSQITGGSLFHTVCQSWALDLAGTTQLTLEVASG